MVPNVRGLLLNVHEALQQTWNRHENHGTERWLPVPSASRSQLPGLTKFRFLAPGCGLNVYQFHPIPLSWKEINGKYGSIWVWFIVGSFRNGMLSLSKITRHCARCLKANETQSKDPLGSCDILGIRPVKLIACHVLRPSCCFIPHWEVLIRGQGNDRKCCLNIEDDGRWWKIAST